MTHAFEGAFEEAFEGAAPATAEEAFARFLALHPRPDFDEYCRRFPAFERELTELHRRQLEISHALEAWGEPAALGERAVRRIRVESARNPALEPESGAPAEELFAELYRKLRLKRDGLGRYTVKGIVGEGGMGLVLAVWDGDLKRNLAMKLVRRERTAGGAVHSDESASVGRFLDEALVTGQLEHPGIVPVHELGLDEQDNLYFTMRLVRGESLNEILRRIHAREKEWSTTRALGILLRACEALAYAHEKRVIHRDLKPANIMVGPFGEVYVMDWGLAKVLTAPESTPEVAPAVHSERGALGGDSPLLTRDGQALGTPHYMPPEQAAGRLAEMGPASDVYSMGAILYHLLAGAPPYAGEGEALPHQVIARVLVGPPRPLAERAGAQPAELVAICEKAMAREPARRYADIGRLADDLRRFLEHRVVQAHRTGARAELLKWVERNRGVAFASVAAGLLAVSGLTSVTVVQAARKHEAVESAAATTRVVQLLTDTLEGFNPRVAQGKPVTAAELLAAIEKAVRANLVQEADRASRVHLFFAMGMGALNRGDAREAERLFRDTLKELSGLAKPDAVLLLRTRRELGIALSRQGTSEAAESALLDALASFGERDCALTATSVQAIEGLGAIFTDVGRPEARARIEALVAELRAKGGAREPCPDEDDVLHLIADVGVLLRDRGEYEADRRVLELVLSALQARPERGAFELLVQESLGQDLRSLGRLQEAEKVLRAVVERRAAQNETDPDAIHARSSLGHVLHDQKRLAEAEACFRKTVELAVKVLDESDPERYRSLSALAQVLIDEGKFDEARNWLDQALEGFERTVGKRHEAYIACLNSIAIVEGQSGAHETARAAFQETLDLSRECLPVTHPMRYVAAHGLVGQLRTLGRLAEAYALQRETLDSYVSQQGPDAPFAQEMRIGLVTVCGQLQRFDEALVLAEEIVARAAPGSEYARLGAELEQKVEAELEALASEPAAETPR